MVNAIELFQVSKRFQQIEAENRSRRASFMLWNFFKRSKPFWALQNVSLTIPRGETVGIIGRNGSGKSTLLQIIGGIIRPTKGSLAVRGKIGALYDLHAGLHPDLTGRDNIITSGLVAGLTRKEIKSRMDSIVAFAELEDFIDCPVRTYSSGMRVRMTFAVMAHTRTDLLLIDEVLAVGDLSFRKKCLDWFKEYKAKGSTIVIVTHELSQIDSLCDRAFWLEKGCVSAEGHPADVIDAYVNAIRNKAAAADPLAAPDHPTLDEQPKPRETKNRLVSIENVLITDSFGIPISKLQSGAGLKVTVDYEARQRIEEPVFVVWIQSENEQILCTVTSERTDIDKSTLQGRGQVVLELERLDLCGGLYHINVGIYNHRWTQNYDLRWRAQRIKVDGMYRQKGVLNPPYSWRLERNKELSPELSASSAQPNV